MLKRGKKVVSSKVEHPFAINGILPTRMLPQLSTPFHQYFITVEGCKGLHGLA